MTFEDSGPCDVAGKDDELTWSPPCLLLPLARGGYICNLNYSPVQTSGLHSAPGFGARRPARSRGCSAHYESRHYLALAQVTRRE